IYFVGRGDAAGIRLGNDLITADRLAELIRDEDADPVVVLNRIGGEGVLDHSSFLHAGFRGLVANTVPVAAQAGHTFAVEFVQAFLYGGEALGAALWKARRAAGPAGLAYVAYCPPTIRVTWEEGAEDESEPDAGPLPEKPYRPLTPYDREDRALFAGRDEDVAQFADVLDKSSTRIMLLHGGSGVGKSSFLRAGVVPYLEDAGTGYRALRDRTPDPEEETPVAEDDRLVLAIRAGQDLAGQIA